MRYLYTADDQLFAYAPGRRDFFKAGDDRLWAHESHDWLVAAESGETLAHRTGDVYYGAVDGERLYRVTSEPDAEATELEETRGFARGALRNESRAHDVDSDDDSSSPVSENRGVRMNVDRGNIERNVSRLATERTELFNRSGQSFGLTAADQNRLKVVERELDECFGALRELRAVRDRDAGFSREDPVVRRAITRNGESTAARPRRLT